MARQQETYCSAYFNVGVCVLWAKCFTSTKIDHEILAVYEPHAMSRPTIVKWCQWFEDGCTDLTNAESQGRPRAVMLTSEMVQWVKDIILINRRVSIVHNAQECGISVGSAHSIVSLQLYYRKLCS